MLRTVSRSVGAAHTRWRSLMRDDADSVASLPTAAQQRRRPGGWRRLLRMSRDVRGVSAIEFAIVAPVVLAIGIGMLKFGVAMSHSLMLTSAAAQGAQTLALSRGTSTPYTSTTTAIVNAAPALTPAQITTIVTINGVACTTDSACSTALVAGQTALVRVTYPCDLTVMGVNYKPNGCTLSAQTAQMVQ
jgi:Flp pilus assembly protein TadG